jgi:hypothetical protein
MLLFHNNINFIINIFLNNTKLLRGVGELVSQVSLPSKISRVSHLVCTVVVKVAEPFLLQQVNNQLVHDFLSQQNNRLFLFLSELMDSYVR